MSKKNKHGWHKNLKVYQSVIRKINQVTAVDEQRSFDATPKGYTEMNIWCNRVIIPNETVTVKFD